MPKNEEINEIKTEIINGISENLKNYTNSDSDFGFELININTEEEELDQELVANSKIYNIAKNMALTGVRISEHQAVLLILTSLFPGLPQEYARSLGTLVVEGFNSKEINVSEKIKDALIAATKVMAYSSGKTIGLNLAIESCEEIIDAYRNGRNIDYVKLSTKVATFAILNGGIVASGGSIFYANLFATILSNVSANVAENMRTKDLREFLHCDIKFDDDDFVFLCEREQEIIKDKDLIKSNIEEFGNEWISFAEESRDTTKYYQKYYAECFTKEYIAEGLQLREQLRQLIEQTKIDNELDTSHRISCKI